jgi:hypothetical protein
MTRVFRVNLWAFLDNEHLHQRWLGRAESRAQGAVQRFGPIDVPKIVVIPKLRSRSMTAPRTVVTVSALSDRSRVSSALALPCIGIFLLRAPSDNPRRHTIVILDRLFGFGLTS